MKIIRNNTEYTLDANEALETYCEYQLYHDTLFVEERIQMDPHFSKLPEKEKKKVLRELAIDMRSLIEDGECSKTAAFYTVLAEFYKNLEEHKEGYAIVVETSEKKYVVQHCPNKETAKTLLKKFFYSMMKNVKRLNPTGFISDDGASAKIVAKEFGMTRETKIYIGEFHF